MRLDGRRAFVTGASRGIGLASAAALARSGAHVYMCARDRKAIEDVANILLAEDAQVTPLQLDISNLDEVTRCIDRIGGLDILVNNAGMNRPQLMVDMSIADFDAVMGLNVRATYFLSQAVVRGMISAGKRGSIINISSQMGHVGGPRRTVYCASKHALEGLTKAMAIELGSVGIRVNTICPTAAPGDAGNPFASTSTLIPFSSSRGTRKSYSWLGSTRKMASSFVMSPSSTI